MTRLCVMCFFLLAPLLLLVGCSIPSGNAEDGKRRYQMHNCHACHGLRGNDGKAPNIAGFKMGFRRFVRKLRRTDAPVMPTFPDSKLSQQDAADIYAYL